VNIELKDFQEAALLDLFKKVERARRVAADNELQAVVLSSPTGSGKTVVITVMMERNYFGGEAADPDPDAVFVWLSDSPELNAQSRDKMCNDRGGPTGFEPVFESRRAFASVVDDLCDV